MLKPLKVSLIISLTFFTGALSVLHSKEIPSFVIESRVNEQVITNFDLEQRKLLLTLFNIEPKKNSDNIIDQLIDEQLQFQFAQNRRIFLSPEEIDNKVSEFLNARSLKKNVLTKVFMENGIEWSTLTSYIGSKFLWKKTLIQLYANKAKISEYDLNLPPPTNTVVIKRLLKISEIVIPFSEHGKDKAVLLSKRLQIELNAGGDFSTAAKRFSRSKSSATGGELELIDEKILPIAVKDVLSNLSVNEVSDPIISQNTVVIFKLNERLNKITQPPLDYLMTFVTVTEKNLDEVAACNAKKKYDSKSILLSDLDKKISNRLQTSQQFKTINLLSNTWIILCDREIVGEIDQINKKKAIYFNKKMIMFSKKLMLKLYRQAIIS